MASSTEAGNSQAVPDLEKAFVKSRVVQFGFRRGRYELGGPPPIERPDHDQFYRKLPDEVWDRPYNPDMDRFLRTDLAAMHLLTIQRLQSKLVRKGLEHRYRDLLHGQPDSVGLAPETDYANSTMRQYVAALQDYDYMRQCALDGRGRDPFLISSDSRSGHALLKGHIESINSQLTPDGISSSPTSGHKGNPYTTPRRDLDYLHFERNPKADWSAELMFFRRFITANMTYWKAYLQRLSAALAVSLFLIAPMVTIIFIPGLSQKPASGVAAGFIFIFAVAAAVVFKDNFGVVSATAAYAAVLVVFVSAGQAVVV